MGDPVLWETVAFLLNYMPILGPMIGVTILVFAGLLSIETLWLTFMPAGVHARAASFRLESLRARHPE
jgi:predicted PurR-regulated permease PerM